MLCKPQVARFFALYVLKYGEMYILLTYFMFLFPFSKLQYTSGTQEIDITMCIGHILLVDNYIILLWISMRELTHFRPTKYAL